MIASVTTKFKDVKSLMSIPQNQRLIFRADGSTTIGLGHVFRCLSLIEMLNQEFECLFIINKPDPAIQKTIGSVCALHTIDINNQSDELNVLASILTKDDILVTDGYQYNETFQKKIKECIKKLVMIDDQADQYFFADLIINHGDPSIQSKYQKDDSSLVLSGYNYLLARKEFLHAAKKEKKIEEVNTVFICMGGSDPFDITTKAIQAAALCTFIEHIIIVVGSAYKNHESLTVLIREVSRNKKITNAENVEAATLVEFIQQSQLAICPASSIALEVCCVKAGLISGTVIANQNAIHAQLVNSSCCLTVNDFNTVSVQTIVQKLYDLQSREAAQQLIDQQHRMIDGQSGERILQQFKQLLS